MKNLLFLFAVLLFSCKTLKKENPQEMKEINPRELSFGSGGGFTGEKTVYKLVENGELFKNGQLIKTFKSDEVKAYFSAAEQIDIESLNDPGNIYNFLIFHRDSLNQSYTWNNKTEIDPKLDQLFTALKAIIPVE